MYAFRNNKRCIVVLGQKRSPVSVPSDLCVDILYFHVYIYHVFPYWQKKRLSLIFFLKRHRTDIEADQ